MLEGGVDLDKEISELQKQRRLQEGSLASFGAEPTDFDSAIYGSSGGILAPNPSPTLESCSC